MYDKTRINVIIEDMRSYKKRLDDMNIKKASDLDDMKFDAASMRIFTVLNKIIDLGDEIVSGGNMGYPIETKDIFVKLRENKVIDEKMEKKLKEFVILRNKFGHRYEKIEKESVTKAQEELKITEDFIKCVVLFLKKELEKEDKNGKKN